MCPLSPIDITAALLIGACLGFIGLVVVLVWVADKTDVMPRP